MLVVALSKHMSIHYTLMATAVEALAVLLLLTAAAQILSTAAARPDVQDDGFSLAPQGQEAGRKKGPRDINQCSCHKSCNPRNEICYDEAVCLACGISGSASAHAIAPQAGRFDSLRASHKCSCRKSCNPRNNLCYDREICLACETGLAPQADAGKVLRARNQKQCTCHKSCNPKNDICYDEAVCLMCKTGGTGVAPQGETVPRSGKCTCHKSCNAKNELCYDETVCLACGLLRIESR